MLIKQVKTENSSWLAIFIASLIPLAIGFFWYNPKVFGKIVKEVGPNQNNPNQHQWYTYLFCWLFSALASFFLLQMINHNGEGYRSFMHGAMHGTILALMVALPILAIHFIFEGYKFTYIAINVAYWFICLALMGGILGLV